MNDTDRILGELKEFKRSAIDKFDKLERKVDAIAHWRWKVTGALTAAIGAAELVRIFLDGK